MVNVYSYFNSTNLDLNIKRVSAVFFVLGVLFGFFDTDVYLAENNFFITLGYFQPITTTNVFKYFFFFFFLFLGSLAFLKRRPKLIIIFVLIFFIFFYLVAVSRMLLDGYGISSIFDTEVRHLAILFCVSFLFIVSDRPKWLNSIISFIYGFVVMTVIRAIITLISYFFGNYAAFNFAGGVSSTIFDGVQLQCQLVSGIIIFLLGMISWLKNNYKSAWLFFLISVVSFMTIIGSFRRSAILITVSVFIGGIIISYFLRRKILVKFPKLMVGITLFLLISSFSFIAFFGLNIAVNRFNSLTFNSSQEQLYVKSNAQYIDDWNAQFEVFKNTYGLGTGFNNSYESYGVSLLSREIFLSYDNEVPLHIGFYVVGTRMGILGYILQFLLFILIPLYFLKRAYGKVTVIPSLIVGFCTMYLFFIGLFPLLGLSYIDIKIAIFLGSCFGGLMYVDLYLRNIRHNYIR